MVSCAAINCTNNTNKPSDVSFFRLPRNEALKKQWVVLLRRENLPKDARVCHIHFEESCFKRDLEVIHTFFSFIVNIIKTVRKK